MGGGAGNQCVSLGAVLVSPETAAPGNRFDLSAGDVYNGGTAPLLYDWHPAAGSTGRIEVDGSGTTATFACTALGPQVVELTIQGGTPEYGCLASATATIDCTSLCGNGVLDPGEGCEPPDGTMCDSTCNLVNGCPTITSMDPVTTNVNEGNGTPIVVKVWDPDPRDTLSYAWTATAGFVYPTTIPSVEYNCTQVGIHTVTVTVSTARCSVSRSLDINCYGWCGDGEVEAGEQCDPPHVGPDGLQCGSNCQFLTCGNGIIDPGEQCDPPQSGVCSQSCQSQFCGNGIVDPGEQCDPPQTGTCTPTCQAVSPPPPQCAVPSPAAAWRDVTSFRAGQINNSTVLQAISPTDVWLMSDGWTEWTTPRTQTVHPPEVLRFDGTVWSSVLGGDSTVDYRNIWSSGSSNDVWLTGDRVRHWNGTAWSDLTPPRAAPSQLSYVIGGTAADDVWVVVYPPPSSNAETLWHWDGATWTDRSPPPPTEGPLAMASVWAVSRDDVWVSGDAVKVLDGGGTQVGPGVLQHWDGTTWTRVPVPSDAIFDTMWGSSANDIWAGGIDAHGIYHYDGQTWSSVPYPPTAYMMLRMWGSCATDIWAVTVGAGIHYDGANWWVVADMPATGGTITGTSANDIWVTYAKAPSVPTSTLSHRGP
jgi:hypothetical protein